MRFLFGAGWWIPWHLAFYAVVLVCVVLTLGIFGQALKAPGQKPDYANVAYAGIVVAGNLVLMWLARTRPRNSVLILGGGQGSRPAPRVPLLSRTRRTAPPSLTRRAARGASAGAGGTG
jgi:hypothetical protein